MKPSATNRISRQTRDLRNPGRGLRALRIVVSVAVLGIMTVALTVGETALLRNFGWLEAVQIVPLTLSVAISALILWIAVTLVFGRIYCSSVCPLGTVQDIAGRMRTRRAPFHYAAPMNKLRFGILIAVLVCVLVGLMAIPMLLDPYVAYDRFCRQILHPVVSIIGGRAVAVTSWYAFVVSGCTIAAVWITAALHGRLACNTVCPVGALLGLLSRNSIVHFDIDTDLCTNCRKCEYVCKCQCINLDDHVVDGSRCVVCFNCTSVCPDNAIRYTTRSKKLSIPMMQRVAGTFMESPEKSPKTSPLSHNETVS